MSARGPDADEDALAELEAAVSRVDAFAAGVVARRAAELSCAPGCTACCRVSLAVSPVEAARVARHLATLDPGTRERLALRAAGRSSRAEPDGGECVMLEPDGRCAVYAARPLVCRTQGLPLRYPAGFVPAEAVRARAGGAEVTWCPLNFTGAAPAAADVLDAERVDALLAVVNRRYAEAHGLDPLARVPLEELAR